MSAMLLYVLYMSMRRGWPGDSRLCIWHPQDWQTLCSEVLSPTSEVPAAPALTFYLAQQVLSLAAAVGLQL
jgi:hypothetical protein